MAMNEQNMIYIRFWQKAGIEDRGLEWGMSGIEKRGEGRCLHPLSGKWDSNPRPSAWEADALPTELLPQIGSSKVEKLLKSGIFSRKKI